MINFSVLRRYEPKLAKDLSLAAEKRLSQRFERRLDARGREGKWKEAIRTLFSRKESVKKLGVTHDIFGFSNVDQEAKGLTVDWHNDSLPVVKKVFHKLNKTAEQEFNQLMQYQAQGLENSIISLDHNCFVFEGRKNSTY